MFEIWVFQDCINNYFGGPAIIGKTKINFCCWPTFFQFAISLSGEPTFYPKLKELIDEINSRGYTSFLVTNGMFPDKIKDLTPTQLYVSLDAPNEEIYNKIDKPIFKDAWKRLNQTLEILSTIKTKTVLRLTLVKGINMCNIEEYAELIKKASPTYVEVKSYMYVGSSQKRLDIENMPYHDEVKEFSEKLAKASGLKVINEKEESRVVLLG